MSDSLLRNPALRNLEPYSGNHLKYGKWRSKIRGILFGEDESYRAALKQMESALQPEIPSRAEGSVEYESQMMKLSTTLGIEPRTLTKILQQMQSLDKFHVHPILTDYLSIMKLVKMLILK